jgi:hypothetical protein
VEEPSQAWAEEAAVLVHLAFVKLEADRGVAADLVEALHGALAGWSAEVMVPADGHAGAAWDVAVEIRGGVEAIQQAQVALSEALAGWPVAASKGWSFTPGVGS